MQVTLLGHTQLAKGLVSLLPPMMLQRLALEKVKSGQVISLAAVRQCYSPLTALEVLEKESDRYFGENGKEGKRLFDKIVKSKHTSTLEHIHFTFAVEGVSRALLAQLTRHRQLSFSVQSQRYNKFSSDSRSGGFKYVIPETVKDEVITRVIDGNEYYTNTKKAYEEIMTEIQNYYDYLIELGVPQEDARSVLPNATACNLVTSGNLRAWLEFYNKRKKGNGAQAEIAEFAEHIKNAIVEVEPWTKEYFEL